jgi:hypothetical protein
VIDSSVLSREEAYNAFKDGRFDDLHTSQDLSDSIGKRLRPQVFESGPSTNPAQTPYELPHVRYARLKREMEELKMDLEEITQESSDQAEDSVENGLFVYMCAPPMSATRLCLFRAASNGVGLKRFEYGALLKGVSSLQQELATVGPKVDDGRADDNVFALQVDTLISRACWLVLLRTPEIIVLRLFRIS